MKKLTDYPSIDNIHNSDYSFFSRNPIIPNMSIYNTINLISIYFLFFKVILYITFVTALLDFIFATFLVFYFFIQQKQSYYNSAFLLYFTSTYLSLS